MRWQLLNKEKISYMKISLHLIYDKTKILVLNTPHGLLV